MSRNYSGSKCPSCKSSSFEVEEETPTASNFKLLFIRCSTCKTVVGVTESNNVGYLIRKLAEALNVEID
jgi:hypothetical protein